MSWDDLDGVGVVGALSQVDTLRFGIPVARIVVGAHEPDPLTTAKVIDSHVRRLGPDVSIVRWPARLTTMAELLTEQGHTLIPADTLVYWGLGLHRSDADKDELISTLLEAPQLMPLLAQSVREIFAGYQSHYSASAVFRGTKVGDGYAQWAAFSAARSPGSTYVAHLGASLCGVATCETLRDGSTLEVELAGIVPRFRGQGVYRRLLQGVMAGAGATGHLRLIISTQAANTVVQAAWAALGFRPFAAMTTVHMRGAPTHV